MKTTAYSLALISSLIATANASAVPRQTCTGITPPLPAITADGTGVSGLQLGNDHPISAAGTGSGILTTTGYTGWNFGTGGLGTPWCPTSRWLNIGSSTHPWKPLTWSSTQSTTTWETGYGVYLTAAATSAYSETSDFLACKPITPSTSIGAPSVQWLLFLLTSDTLPTATDDTLSNANISTCVKTKLLIGLGDSGGGW
ncbi:hypothetical protein M407DRAFT_27599 [Tulasnella calospora MUT 4182]|uniref:Uncharacterized protein n=2 Tax=Tulasnella calospora MUT 4182 TaxID=1051891 RepID=A0A0C3LNF9_9AGAM|nr:hypothetical protein M407DRAFT_27599 [Tulasnella calospora MUT 4182]